MKGRRRLTPEEIALWAEVARSVTRRRGAAAPAAPAPPRKAAEAPAPALAPLERKLRRGLARGRGGVDAALDLHGLNQAEAHRALRSFLVEAQARGSKLVIVITGKGRSAEATGEPGVLRRLAPHWLREPDLSAIVLGFEEAARVHGGAGALYVRLRRAR